MFIAATATNAATSLTSAKYILQMFGYDCHYYAKALVAVGIIIIFTILNCVSTKVSGWVAKLFSVCKITAVSILIVSGIVYMARGHTENYEDAFKGTTHDVGQWALATVNAYFAYTGWECINTMPEEMKNPQRDLLPAAATGLLIISTVYTLTNMAYFSVMTPSEIVNTPAVALDFMREAVGSPTGIITSIFVALACMGTVNACLFSETRYLFAAGRNGQMPAVTSTIHKKFKTPMVAIIVTGLISICFCFVPRISTLTVYSSLAIQVKILLAMTAFFVLRYKEPNLHRPVKIPIFFVIIIYVVMLALAVASFYQDPFNWMIFLIILFSGFLLLFTSDFLGASAVFQSCMDGLTSCIQRTLNVVPETEEEVRRDLGKLTFDGDTDSSGFESINGEGPIIR